MAGLRSYQPVILVLHLQTHNDMKTYSEINGEPPYDWWAFLEKAKAGTATYEEIQDARYKSSDWVTCACGNQCDVIPRNIYGAPVDVDLQCYGEWFMDFVRSSEWVNAESTLRSIEQRAAEILAELK